VPFSTLVICYQFILQQIHTLVIGAQFRICGSWNLLSSEYQDYGIWDYRYIEDEVADSSKMFVPIYQTVWYHITKDSVLIF